LTSGRNLDTNCQWLSRELAEIGIPVGWHTTVADDLPANVEVFRVAAGRAALVIATGGLGPTQDDLTREALANVAAVELVFHQGSYDWIASIFERFKRPMPERNRVQAMFPAGSEVLANDRGTAPGIWMKLADSHIAAMPGVPNEMYAMYEKQVKTRILKLGLSSGVLIERKINVFGAGESAVEKKLFDLTKRGHVPEVGITVSEASISLRILANAPAEADARKLIAPVEQTIRERLGDLIFGADDEELQDALLVLLASKRKTLAAAEGVTGGLVSEQLTSVAGASSWFRGGIVAYDNQTKTEFLRVPQALLDEHGAVSEAAAKAMAIGCRTRWRTDLAVSTVGVAGPGGLANDKPAGLVFVGLAWDGGDSVATLTWSGTRSEIRQRTAKLALNHVRLHLLRGVN
ncbi:MAG: competence/damage-inducible protein A, partial [Candidatus Acidiferrum sp.]